MELMPPTTWMHKIDFIKNAFPSIHLIYSLTEEWAYVSWKSDRKRIDNNMSPDQISEVILEIIKK